MPRTTQKKLPPRRPDFDLCSAQISDSVRVCTITADWNLKRTPDSSCNDDILVGIGIQTDDKHFRDDTYIDHMTCITRHLHIGGLFQITQGMSSHRLTSGCITAVYVNGVLYAY